MNRKLAMIFVLVPLVMIFVYVAFSSGPLAPVPVVVTKVESGVLKPAISGIGTVEAQRLHKIASTQTGRVQQIMVDVGEWVNAGQVVAILDPVDLDEKIEAQQAAILRIQSAIADAQLKLSFAKAQTTRYTQLLSAKATQEEQLAIKRQEQRLAESTLELLAADMKKARADLRVLEAQEQQMHLIAPISGRVAARFSEVGNTVVSGQSLLEVYDPKQLWIHTRFDQIHAQGLTQQLPVSVQLRSQSVSLSGQLVRIEPKADAVTEEMLAKIVIHDERANAAHIGELAIVTVKLPERQVALRLPNAAIQRQQARIGVWRVDANDAIEFVDVSLGTQDLEGQIEVLSGLSVQDRVVLYSQKPLSTHSRVMLVEHLVDATP